MPMYWFMAITYPIWDVIINHGSIINNIILVPIELLGLQNVFHSLFGYTHNGGTWFVSCILFCYLIFPFVYNIVKEIRLKMKVNLGILLGIILLYSSFLTGFLKIEGIYSNIFFRMLEFVIGMLLCSIWWDVKETKWYKFYFAKRVLFICVFGVLLVSVTVLVKMNILVGDYMVYSVVGLPCFSLLVFSGAGIDTPIVNSSKIIEYAVNISYAFFFAQFYTWKITLGIINFIGVNTNIIRISISFIICLLIAIVMHEAIEKPIKRLLTKKIIL